MSARDVLVLVTVVVAVSSLVAACGGENRSAATVGRVVDGDTLELTDGDRVRLVQIDTPEVGEGECYAESAKRELIRLTPSGARVHLETDPDLDREDRYGRLLRYVHTEDWNVNVELVRRGAAAPYFHSGERGVYASDLLAAVQNARRARRGMWGDCRVTWRPDALVDTRSR